MKLDSAALVCIAGSAGILGRDASKKIENLAWAVSLHFMHYNFARPHKTLTKRYPTTPAMAAGVADHVWTLEEIAGLLEG